MKENFNYNLIYILSNSLGVCKQVWNAFSLSYRRTQCFQTVIYLLRFLLYTLFDKLVLVHGGIMGSWLVEGKKIKTLKRPV
ncbi:hypothetical protein CMV16_18335 [Peribacillus simplex]|nr:hypothetical protein CMV16_18335 [Peribacillus simplex]